MKVSYHGLQEAPTQIVLDFACLSETRPGGFREPGIPRAVAAAARAGTRYFVKAIAIVSLATNKGSRGALAGMQIAEATASSK